MTIAWYDPTNHHVSTDKHDPLFTPLGQLWPLVVKQEWVGLTDEDIKVIVGRNDSGGIGAYTREMFKQIEDKLREKNRLVAVVGRKADGGEHRRPDGSSKKREDKMIWSEQTIPERVATLQREYERRAKELYPEGVPMEAYKKEPMRHGLYQDYMTFANQLGTILEKK